VKFNSRLHAKTNPATFLVKFVTKSAQRCIVGDFHGVSCDKAREMAQDQLQQFIPVGLLLLVAVGFAAMNLLLPVIVGKKRVHTPVKDSPYECGMPPMTEAHTRFSVRFHVIAMLFILFDVEVVFLLGWSAVFRELTQEMGWQMFAGGALFVLILEVGHIYAFKEGALDWAPRRNQEARKSRSETKPKQTNVEPIAA
jgi:NADH-quinone oxidoreductase subunit A